MSDLMVYLPPLGEKPRQQPQRPVATSGAAKYQNPEVVAGFDAKRKEDPKRVLSKNIIRSMLADLPGGTKVVDAGCGTGLLFDFFNEKSFTTGGIDLSEAMLAEAASRLNAWDAAGQLKGNFSLAKGSVLALPLKDKAAEVSVMCDVTRWLSPEECQQAMRELQRVTRSRIIWTARIANHTEARTIELFEAALDGWRITRNEVGIDMDYRILMAEPA